QCLLPPAPAYPSHPHPEGRRLRLHPPAGRKRIGLLWLSTATQDEKYGRHYSALTSMLGTARQHQGSQAQITLSSLLPAT
ncbi:hypothetical protein Q4519_22115, partial [Motilimonas sp. 1_MG-2023]|uniref:hypothetical protein n=1 Tax=Motilimonas sp. 1_MG-2023 TaxID=3062672 RepID=UPI0026E4797B